MKIDLTRSFGLALFISVPASLLLVGLGKLLLLSTNTLIVIYSFAVLFSVGIWGIHLIRLQGKLQNIEDLLYREKKPMLYIRKTERLLRKIYSSRIRPLIWLNLSAGYAAEDILHMADKILDTIDPKELIEVNQAIYYCNKAQYSFYGGDITDAIRMIDERKELLMKYIDEPSLSCRISTVFAYYYLEQFDMENAKEYIERAESSCKNAYRKDHIDFLKMSVAVLERDYEKAAQVKAELIDRGVTPLLERLISIVKAGKRVS
ncbi:hypothetical protein D7X25_23540 [bacterium 1XD42-8]|nr:hypothetical protein [Lachnospiraceae bacterium]RKJ46273.1 hypothetical protein D7X25_23540 [bacterium 1XD42-8]